MSVIAFPTKINLVDSYKLDSTNILEEAFTSVFVADINDKFPVRTKGKDVKLKRGTWVD